MTLREDWETVKYSIMEELVRPKSADYQLREMLLATGEAELIEGNTWGDRTWGCVRIDGGWVGQNQLGKILMKVREELR